LGIWGFGAAIAAGAGEASTATTPVRRRWVPARRLLFTEVAATLWTTAAADGAAGGFRAGACTGVATSVTTDGRLGPCRRFWVGVVPETKGRGKSATATTEELGREMGTS
jgi:hypothetical protein